MDAAAPPLHSGTVTAAVPRRADRVPDPVTLVLVLGMLAAFGPLAIDMYLPAFPVIGADLDASATAVGWTLAVYFAGLSLGQVVIGPITDRVGRTRPLRAGLVLFAAGSIAAALAPRIELLIAARALQAIGGAACAVTSRAVVRDLYRGADAARMSSRLVLVMGVAPMVAPFAGSGLLAVAGWRAIFALLAVVAAIALAVVTRALPETAPPFVPVGRRAALRALVGDRAFVGHALVVALSVAGLFTYITGAPFVFLSLHGVDRATFACLFAGNAAGYIAASQLNARLLRAFRPEALLGAGLVGVVIASAALVAIAVTGAGVAATEAALFSFLAGVGFIVPNANAIALDGQGARAGNASAWLGALQFGVAAGASALVSALDDGTARPIAAVMLTAALLANLTLVITRWDRAVAGDVTRNGAAQPPS
jgi:MFS transporter, DHA1 family, multidrug resistance protein